MVMRVDGWGHLWRSSGLSLIALLSACAEGELTAPRVAAKGGAHLAAQSEVRFADLPGFLERERFVVIGNSYDDGRCGYRSRRTLRPGEREAEHLVSFDPSQCRFVVSRGSYRRPLMQSPSTIAVDTLRTLPVGTAAARNRTELGRTSTYSSCVQVTNVSYAFQNTILVDPVAIQVTRDETSVSWWWDGSCVHSAAGLHTMQWFTGSNWSRYAWYTDNLHYGWYGSGLDPNYVFATNWSVFRNPGFPTGFPLCTSEVYAYHIPNTIYGYSDGSASFDAEITLGGPNCINLLDRVIERWVN